MTKKARLINWAEALGVSPGPDATVAQLEQAIESAIATPKATAEAPAEAPSISLGEGIRNNARVLRQELPGVVSAVASNLLWS